MKTVNSLSGGQTSSYIAAHYPADYNVFALVRIEDERCKFPDAKIRQEVEDRIQAPFIATAEDDIIIYTMLDLEQFIGKKIDWVSGYTFEHLIKKRNGNRLPNKVERNCTTYLKMLPMFEWWYKTICEPVEMRIGFRANEINRANKTLSQCNEDGFNVFKGIIGKSENGRNKWATLPWRKPSFKLIEDNIYKIDIKNYLNGKLVRFAEINNCLFCHLRVPPLLRLQFQKYPAKGRWWIDIEQQSKGTWKTGITYEQIRNFKSQLLLSLTYDDFSECDSGYCEVA
jgi:hypothetical protein